MTWTWRIESSLPSTAPTGTLTNRSINLMCYLLKDVNFNLLYSLPLESAVDAMIANAEVLPSYLAVDAAGNSFPTLSAELLDHLRAFKTILDGRQAHENDVRAGNFFHTPFPTTSLPPWRLYVELNDAFDDLRRDTRLDHFCIPFIAMQKDPQKLITADNVDDFLSALGGKTLHNLFTESKCDYSLAQRTAIRDAKHWGILTTYATLTFTGDDYQANIVNLKNNHKCDASTLTCQPENGYWCNAGDNNSCSAISD